MACSIAGVSLGGVGATAIAPSLRSLAFEAGAEAVDDLGAESAPWEEAAAAFPGGGDFHRAAGRLLQAVFQIGKGGSPAQWAAASEVMETARKQLYKILAED